MVPCACELWLYLTGTPPFVMPPCPALPPYRLEMVTWCLLMWRTACCRWDEGLGRGGGY